MKKNIKKSLSLILAAIMLLCSLPMAVSAVDTFTQDGYTYTVTDSKATITKADSSVVKGDVTIPSTLDGYAVIAIRDEAFKSNNALTGVVIPDSVPSIGNRAFGFCDSLATVTLPKDLTTIEGNAFTNCTNLTSIVIPAGVKAIKGNAFYNCSALATIPSLATTLIASAGALSITLHALKLGRTVMSM